MSDPLVIDLFAEDRAHEEWLRPLIERVTREAAVEARIRVRAARGGHGRALAELDLYQRTVSKGLGGAPPDLLVVGIDANCKSFAETQSAVGKALREPLVSCAILATPDPHVERWFLADLEAFHRVVGITPAVEAKKCEREYYKNVLAKAIENAGHPPTLGGIEFARELVEALDYYRAGKADNSFKHFLDALRARVKQHKG